MVPSVITLAEFKIAVSHRLFSNKTGYFQIYVKVFGPFSEYLINLYTHNNMKWLNNFVNGQMLVKVFGHLSVYFMSLI